MRVSRNRRRKWRRMRRRRRRRMTKMMRKIYRKGNFMYHMNLAARTLKQRLVAL